jgi:hypothetical protein
MHVWPIQYSPVFNGHYTKHRFKFSWPNFSTSQIFPPTVLENVDKLFCTPKYACNITMIVITKSHTNPHWARVVRYGPFSLCIIHKEGLCPSSGDINRLMMMTKINKVGVTFRRSSAVARRSTSTSRHWSRKSWNTAPSLSLSLMSGFPLVAIRYNARSGFSFKYGGSPSIISIAIMPSDHTSTFNKTLISVDIQMFSQYNDQ